MVSDRGPVPLSQPAPSPPRPPSSLGSLPPGPHGRAGKGPSVRESGSQSIWKPWMPGTRCRLRTGQEGPERENEGLPRLPPLGLGPACQCPGHTEAPSGTAQEPPLHPLVLLQERPQLWLGHQLQDDHVSCPVQQQGHLGAAPNM
ncbi:hypothetical protein VULLAG_LOCUS18111 [Vulpes lagopus]